MGGGLLEVSGVRDEWRARVLVRHAGLNAGTCEQAGARAFWRLALEGRIGPHGLHTGTEPLAFGPGGQLRDHSGCMGAIFIE